MVKQTQTIRRLLKTNCLSLFDYFVGLALERLITVRIYDQFIAETPSYQKFVAIYHISPIVSSEYFIQKLKKITM